jgi:cytochrome P450
LLSHALYLLSQNPECLKRLRNEVSENLSDNPSDWNFDLIHQGLPFMTAVLKETLRTHTSIPDIFMRIAQKDHYIKDVFIKKGTRVEMLLTVPCSSPKYFENPETFNPARWLPGKGDCFSEEINPLVYIPFSAGQRECIGKQFALFEAKVILGRFLQKFEFKFDKETTQSVEWVMRYVYEPKNPLIFNCSLKK